MIIKGSLLPVLRVEYLINLLLIVIINFAVYLRLTNWCDFARIRPAIS